MTTPRSHPRRPSSTLSPSLSVPESPQSNSGQHLVTFVLKMYSRDYPDSIASSPFTPSVAGQKRSLGTGASFGGAASSSTEMLSSSSALFTKRVSVYNQGRDEWICLSSTRPLFLKVVYNELHQSVGTGAGVDCGKPLLVIQSEQQTLEQFSLNANSVRTSKLQGIMKGSIIGFRYRFYAPGSNIPEIRKFQAKFRSDVESGQCASLLQSFIECRASRGSISDAGPASGEPSPQDTPSSDPTAFARTASPSPTTPITTTTTTSAARVSTPTSRLSTPTSFTTTALRRAEETRHLSGNEELDVEMERDQSLAHMFGSQEFSRSSDFRGRRSWLGGTLSQTLSSTQQIASSQDLSPTVDIRGGGGRGGLGDGEYTLSQTQRLGGSMSQTQVLGSQDSSPPMDLRSGRVGLEVETDVGSDWAPSRMQWSRTTDIEGSRSGGAFGSSQTQHLDTQELFRSLVRGRRGGSQSGDAFETQTPALPSSDQATIPLTSPSSLPPSPSQSWTWSQQQQQATVPLTITPRYGSQPIPVCPSPAPSPLPLPWAHSSRGGIQSQQEQRQQQQQQALMHCQKDATTVSGTGRKVEGWEFLLEEEIKRLLGLDRDELKMHLDHMLTDPTFPALLRLLERELAPFELRQGGHEQGQGRRSR